jgi:hypothetical protein
MAVGIRWYAVALLTAPLAMTGGVAGAVPAIPAVPSRAGDHRRIWSAVAGIGVGLAGGFLEELGWTGFAIPSLSSRSRSGPLPSRRTMHLWLHKSATAYRAMGTSPGVVTLVPCGAARESRTLDV